MKNKPSVSVIILNYNGRRFLSKCLSSVLRTRYPSFEVILVDNGSTDESLNVAIDIAATNKRLRIVKNSKNLGFGPANNIGFEYATGDYIVFLNNDTAVDPDWLDVLVDVMEKDQTIGLAQSMILSMNGNTLQTAGWLVSDYWVFLHSIVSADETQMGQFPDVFEISYASGTAMITRRKLIQEIGLFDAKYFWFYDDNYLSFKTWIADKRVVTVSKSKVYHVGGGTSGWGNFFTARHATICLISLVFDVYRNLLRLTKALFVLNFYIIITSLKRLVEQRETTRIWANISAIWWILKNLRHIWRSRLKYWSNARIDEKTLLSRMIRIHIPTSIYLVSSPAKLLWLCLKNETAKYQRSLVHASQDHMQA